MHLVRATDPQPSGSKTHGQSDGLAAWLLNHAGSVVTGLTGALRGRPARRHMQVIETLQMGNRKQLLLVSCGGERFLVGSGAEGVGTIVRVRPEAGSAARSASTTGAAAAQLRSF